MTVDHVDKILTALARNEYMVEMDSIIYGERNELIIKTSKLDRLYQAELQKSQAYKASMDSKDRIIALLNEDVVYYKQRIRKARTAAWRDRLIAVGLFVGYILIQK